MLETSRLLLREWTTADEAPFIKINADKDVMHYFPSILTENETLAMMDRMRQHFIEWGYGLFAAEHKGSKELIGFIGLSHPRFENHLTPCVEIGWRLDARYWNQGLATEGAIAVRDYAFDMLQLDEILSWTATINKPSERIMQKIGMQYDSIFIHPNLDKEDPLAEHVVYRLAHEHYGA